MTEYEITNLGYQKVALIINGLYLAATLLLAVVALFGERIKQLWSHPKLQLILDEPTLTGHSNSDEKGWYYHLRVKNDRKHAPAKNVRVLLYKLMKKGPDGSWLEQKFSGPVQVMWIWADNMPQYLTVGPDVQSTFCCSMENSTTINLKLYLMPMNLLQYQNIVPDDPTRLMFKAVSDIAESNNLTLELAWDGQWEQGASEMKKHFIVKTIDS